eukprot:7094155-Alexandrium_andersonii.AAC.1
MVARCGCPTRRPGSSHVVARKRWIWYSMSQCVGQCLHDPRPSENVFGQISELLLWAVGVVILAWM